MTFDVAVVERVEAAWRLAAAGHAIRAIANQLGVSVSTVHSHLRARTCPECGGPVPTPRGALHRVHVPRADRSEALDARGGARRDPRLDGEAGPSSQISRLDPVALAPWPVGGREPPLAERGGGLRPIWRSPRSVERALADAGAAVGFRRWSDDAIRTSLAAYATRTGRRLTAEDVATRERRGPAASTLRRRFGSVERAWDALGPIRRRRAPDARDQSCARSSSTSTPAMRSARGTRPF
jgi:hypothetical protein